MGDTSSTFSWGLGVVPPVVYRQAAFVLKINCELVELACLLANYTTTNLPVYTNTKTWNSDQSIFDFTFITSATLNKQSLSSHYGLGFDFTYDTITLSTILKSRNIYACTVSTNYDISEPGDYLLGTTAKEMAYIVKPFCHDMGIPIGINRVNFTNDTTG